MAFRSTLLRLPLTTYYNDGDGEFERQLSGHPQVPVVANDHAAVQIRHLEVPIRHINIGH